MSLRQTQFSPLIRGIAAATIFVWLGALALCQTECCSGDEHDSASTDHHHAEAGPHSHDHDKAPGSQQESSVCLSLKSVLNISSAVSIPKVVLQPLYDLALAPTPSTDTAETWVISHFRQTRPGKWVLTPEVCLGPAFRSLAPPYLPIA